MVSCGTPSSPSRGVDKIGRDSYLRRDPAQLYGSEHVARDSEARWADNLRLHSLRSPLSTYPMEASVQTPPFSPARVGVPGGGFGRTHSRGLNRGEAPAVSAASPSSFLQRSSSAPLSRGGTAHSPLIPKSPWMPRPTSRPSSAQSAANSRNRAAQTTQAPASATALRSLTRSASRAAAAVKAARASRHRSASSKRRSQRAAKKVART